MLKHSIKSLLVTTIASGVVLSGLVAANPARAESPASGTCKDGNSTANITAWFKYVDNKSFSSWHEVGLLNSKRLGNKNNLHLESWQDIPLGADKKLKQWTSGDDIQGQVYKNYWQIAGVSTPKGKQYAIVKATFDVTGVDDECTARTQNF